MANQHSHSLKDTSRLSGSRAVDRRIHARMFTTLLLVCMVIVAIAMVLMNYASLVHRGALAISIVALATQLNSITGNDEFTIRRISKPSSAL